MQLELWLQSLRIIEPRTRSPPGAISITQAYGQALAEMCTPTCSNPNSPSCIADITSLPASLHVEILTTHTRNFKFPQG